MRQDAPKAPKAPQTTTTTGEGGSQTTIRTTQDGQVIIQTKEGAEPLVAPEASVLVPPPIPVDPNRMPEGVKEVSIAFFVCTALTIVLFPLARALARRMDRGAALPAPANAREHEERLQRIETAVDSIAIEVERISEGQRFTTKLLADKADAVPAERRTGTS